MQVWLGAGALFVDHVTEFVAFETKFGRHWMRFFLGQQMGVAPATRWRSFEAAITPAAIKIETVHGSFVDERRSIHRHVDETPPHTQ